MKTTVNTQTESIWPYVGMVTVVALLVALILTLLFTTVLLPKAKEAARIEGIAEGRKHLVKEAIDYGHAAYHVGRYGDTAWSWNTNCTNAAVNQRGLILVYGDPEHVE